MGNYLERISSVCQICDLTNLTNSTQTHETICNDCKIKLRKLIGLIGKENNTEYTKIKIGLNSTPDQLGYDWRKFFPKMSVRLFNILSWNFNDRIICQINKKEFLECRNAGLCSWTELNDLIVKYASETTTKTENKKTAIDWLVKEVNEDCLNSTFIRHETIEKAKKMESEQQSLLKKEIEFMLTTFDEIRYVCENSLPVNSIRISELCNIVLNKYNN